MCAYRVHHSHGLSIAMAMCFVCWFHPCPRGSSRCSPRAGVPKTWRAMGASHQRYLASGDGSGEKKQEPWENHQKTMGKCVDFIDILFIMVCEQGEPLVVWKQWGEKRVAFRSVCHGLQDPSGSKSFCMVPSHWRAKDVTREDCASPLYKSSYRI